MNLNENIANAVVVLQKTYESVNKMLEQCRAISGSYGYIWKTFPLSGVTADTLGDMAFGTFNELEALVWES